MTSINIQTALVNLDSPIQSLEEDLLQRRCFVQNLRQIFEAAPSKESTVFALYGEWGSGKTSVKNLLKRELADHGNKSLIPIEFNPWAFSGQDQVLEAFFSEIGKAIGRETNGKEAAEIFKKLGGYLSFGAKTVKTIHVGMDLFSIPGSKLVGIFGEQLQGGAKNAKEFGKDINAVDSTSLEEIQKDLKAALSKFEHTLLVILDDLDRLTPDQLLTVFQIVKQNANLPGVNYLLLMDIETITDRLKQKGLGAEFVEKIVQFDLALPHISGEELKSILKEGFKVVMGKYEGQINWERWEEAWLNGTQNLFTTLRRIKRFLNTLKFHVNFFANDDVLEVDPVDLFLIETVRKFAPDTYSVIPRGFRDSVIFEYIVCTLIRIQHSEKKGEFGKKKLAELVELAPEDHRMSIERILTLLFPQINDSQTDEDRNFWLRDSRICNELSFDSYFRMAIPRQLITQQEIANLFTSLDEQVKLRAVLMSLYEKIGLSTLLHRIYIHRRRLDRKYLSRLLAELWRLEELDAVRAGVERDWSIRESGQQTTKALLSEFSDKSDRCGIVTEALIESNVVYTMALIWVREHHVLTKSPNLIGTTLDKEELEQLRPTIIKEINRASEDGRLLKMPDLGLFMRVWEDIEGKDAVQKWLNTQSKDQRRLSLILMSLINKIIIHGRDVQVKYSISRQNLEQFFNPIEQLESLLAGLDIQTLPHWEKFAVEETLKCISRKKQGIEEVPYQ